MCANRCVFKYAKRKPSYGISRYRGDVDHCRHQKPARLDKYSRNQCFFDDIYRSFFVFWHKEIFDNCKQHHKSQGKVSKVFHHIPKFPKRGIKMENRRINERIIQSKSSQNQKRPEEEIDEFEDHIHNLPESHSVGR